MTAFSPELYLASVQTASDSAPMTWGYVLTALAFAAALAAFIALPAYLDSHFHRRGVARLRAHRRRMEGHRS